MSRRLLSKSSGRSFLYYVVLIILNNLSYISKVFIQFCWWKICSLSLPFISLPGLHRVSAGEVSLELLNDLCLLFLSLPLCGMAGEPEKASI